MNKKGQQRNREGEIIIGAILAVLLLIGASIIIARALFPYFIVLSGIAFILTFLAIVRDIFFREEYEDVWFIFPLGALGILLLVSMTLLAVGYGLSETGIGQAGLTVYNILGITIDTTNQVTNTINDIPKQVLNETCKAVNNSESCKMAERSIDTINTINDVADTLQTAKNVADLAKK